MLIFKLLVFIKNINKYIFCYNYKIVDKNEWFLRIKLQYLIV
jgi:hypothetical protein